MKRESIVSTKPTSVHTRIISLITISLVIKWFQISEINTGEMSGAKVLHHIARNPLGLNSLSKGLLLATGKNQDEHYLDIMDKLKNTHPFKFDIQDDTVNVDKQLVKPSSCYTSYRYPYFIGDSSFVALKSSLQDIPCFVLVDRNQQEQVLFVPGTILDESVSFSNGKLVWIETKPDLRWTQQRTFAVAL